MFKFIDLFAGIGGFHSALNDLGGDCVLACEFDEDCQIVYKSTFPNTKLISNIREITRNDIEDDNSTRNLKEIKSLVPDHDVLCAGFPCQPFSKSGKQKGILDKARGTLFFDIMQIVKAKHPKYLILENVRNLTGPKHSETWKLIIESIREEGYTVSGIPTILSPHLIPKELGGAPQVRDRVFIAATLNGKNEPLYIEREPYKHNHNPDNWNIAEYLISDNAVSQSEPLSNYRLTKEELTWLNAWDYLVSKLDSNTLPGFPIWVDALTSNPIIEDDMPLWKKNFLIKNSNFYEINKKFLDKWKSIVWKPANKKIEEFPMSRQKFEWQARKAFPTKKNRTIKSLVLQFRPSGIRVKPASYLPALVAITQTSIVGPNIRDGIKDFRKITPIEASKLQGIDGSIFKKAGVPDNVAYKQLGNGVNTGVVKYVFSQLCEDVNYFSESNFRLDEKKKLMNKYKKPQNLSFKLL